MSGAVIPKAHVEILDVSTTFRKKLDADVDGKLSIDLPFGTYEVMASYPAFKTEKKKIEVTTANQTITFMLNVGGGSTVEVVPMPSGSEPTYANLPDALEDESNIPPLGRNIDAYSFCCPGVPQSTIQNSKLPPGSIIMPPPSHDPEKPSYTITISAPRRATVRSEVKLHIITKNISDKAIYLVRPPGRGLEISVRDSQGNSVHESTNDSPWSMPFIIRSENAFTQRYPVQPGDRVEEDLNVSAEYEFSKPGTYSIQVLRSDILTEEEINAHLSPQAVKSNAATIRLVQ